MLYNIYVVNIAYAAAAAAAVAVAVAVAVACIETSRCYFFSFSK